MQQQHKREPWQFKPITALCPVSGRDTQKSWQAQLCPMGSSATRPSALQQQRTNQQISAAGQDVQGSAQSLPGVHTADG